MHLPEPHVLRREMDQEQSGHCFRLVSSIPGTAAGRLQQQRRRPQRSGRRGLDLEHEVQEKHARVHFPLSELRALYHFREVSS